VTASLTCYKIGQRGERSADAEGMYQDSMGDLNVFLWLLEEEEEGGRHVGVCT